MNAAIAYTRHLSIYPAEAVRVAIVVVCALTLIAAGQVLPY